MRGEGGSPRAAPPVSQPPSAAILQPASPSGPIHHLPSMQLAHKYACTVWLSAEEHHPEAALLACREAPLGHSPPPHPLQVQAEAVDSPSLTMQFHQ